MAYTKTTWATGDVITAAKLNNLETQYDKVFTDAIWTGTLSAYTETIFNSLTYTQTTTGSTNFDTYYAYSNDFPTLTLPAEFTPKAGTLTLQSCQVTVSNNMTGNFRLTTKVNGVVVATQDSGTITTSSFYVPLYPAITLAASNFIVGANTIQYMLSILSGSGATWWRCSNGNNPTTTLKYNKKVLVVA